ncbi:MAG: site-specific integrase [Elusimicrobiota bacterium]
MDLKQYSKGFDEYLRLVRGVAETTLKDYKDYVKEFFTFLKDRNIITMEQIKPEIIIFFLEYLSKEKNNCPSTRNKKLSALKMFFSYMVNMELIDITKDPVKNIPLTKNRQFGKLPRILNTDEVTKLLKQPDRKNVSKIC